MVPGGPGSQFAPLPDAHYCPPHRHDQESPETRYRVFHELVRQAAEYVVQDEKSVGGQLGRPSSARFKTYERLKNYAEQVKEQIFDTPELRKTVEEIYRYPLRQNAIDSLNRQLKSGISDEGLAELAVALREDGRLCLIGEEEEVREPRVICSLGLKKA